MQRIVNWLNKLGLGQCAQRFATQLSARMDLEDLREVIWTYQKAVAEG